MCIQNTYPWLLFHSSLLLFSKTRLTSIRLFFLKHLLYKVHCVSLCSDSITKQVYMHPCSHIVSTFKRHLSNRTCCCCLFFFSSTNGHYPNRIIHILCLKLCDNIFHLIPLLLLAANNKL